jgi:hypothetical protein
LKKKKELNQFVIEKLGQGDAFRSKKFETEE